MLLQIIICQVVFKLLQSVPNVCLKELIYLLTEINHTSTGIRKWINNYIHIKQSDIITHPCPHSNGGLAAPQLKFKEWVRNYILPKAIVLFTYPFFNLSLSLLYSTWYVTWSHDLHGDCYYHNDIQQLRQQTLVSFEVKCITQDKVFVNLLVFAYFLPKTVLFLKETIGDLIWGLNPLIN